MYLTAVILICCYACWWFAARKEHTAAVERGLLRPFCRMAQLLCRKVYEHRGKLPFENMALKDLHRLYPNCARQRQTDYFVKKIGIMLAVLLLGMLFSVFAKLQSGAAVSLGRDGIVKRGALWEGEQRLTLEAEVEGIGKEKVELAVAEKALDRENGDRLYKEFLEILLHTALGKNVSWQEIRTDLNLAEELEGYPFRVSWMSSDPGLLSDTGLIGATEGLTQESGATASLTALISYRDREWEEIIEMRILPPLLTAQQSRRKELESMAAEAEKAAREEETFALPGEWREHSVVWKQITDDNSLLFFVLAAMAAAAVYFLTDRDLHRQAERRRQAMREMYPALANKLVLFMGAGMTVRGALFKIGEDYRKRQEADKTEGLTERENPVYEEILYACHELQTGVSETAALEHLGRRTSLQEYTRLCTLLTQNLKKGNKTLLCRLREESEKAMQEQINLKRQAGEEASTRLLIPMVMMLGIVMVIIMIPAFSSFGI